MLMRPRAATAAIPAMFPQMAAITVHIIHFHIVDQSISHNPSGNCFPINPLYHTPFLIRF